MRYFLFAVALLASFGAAGQTIGPGAGGGFGTVTSVANPSIFGVTCSVANATTTPTITCATSGALTIGSVNGLTITPTTGTFTLAAAKTLTVSNTLTFAGTDGSTLNIGAGGTLGALAFITPGTGIATALGVNVGSAGAPVLVNGAGGTPSSLTLTNATGLPVAGGGTGAATLSGIIFGNGTSPFTAGNLSGDCTTSGLVITCTKINGDSNIAFLDVAQSFTKPQRTNTISPTISTATFTPVFSTSQNYRIALSSACPCTLANPAAIVAGQAGMFEIVQDGTGSRTIGTYGSEYEYAGGTSTITLSTAASAVDYIPYYVDSTGSFIVLGGIIKGPTH